MPLLVYRPSTSTVIATIDDPVPRGIHEAYEAIEDHEVIEVPPTGLPANPFACYVAGGELLARPTFDAQNHYALKVGETVRITLPAETKITVDGENLAETYHGDTPFEFEHPGTYEVALQAGVFMEKYITFEVADAGSQ